MCDTVDYSEAFPAAVAAQGKARNFLLLYSMDQARERANGDLAQYRLVYRWLSKSCLNPRDEAWACARGVDDTLWTEGELLEIGALGGDVNLFECFNLF